MGCSCKAEVPLSAPAYPQNAIREGWLAPGPCCCPLSHSAPESPLPFLMREGRVVPHEQAPLSPTQPGLSALKDRGCISVPCSLSLCQRLHRVGVVVFTS